MLLLIEQDTTADEVPDWSGTFEQTGPAAGIIRVHNSDMRQHFAPHGWEATGHSTFPDGTFETYTFRRMPDHDHTYCPDCGV